MQEVVKCYLFLIFARILWIHPLGVLVPDATLHWSFPWRISSVNVTKSAGNYSIFAAVQIPNQDLSQKLKKYIYWLGKCHYTLQRIWAKRGVSKQVWFVAKTAGGLACWEWYNPHLSLETVLPALKLPHNCYIINIKSDFPTHYIYPAWKTILTIWQNMKARKFPKNPNFPIF